MNDFSKKTIKALANKGITLVGLQAHGYSENAYVLNHNGTCVVRTFKEVLELAGSK